MSTVWVLTREVNEYNQDGEYYVCVFANVPSLGQLKDETGIADEEYLIHIQRGGGRTRELEDEWYNLMEVWVNE